MVSDELFAVQLCTNMEKLLDLKMYPFIYLFLFIHNSSFVIYFFVLLKHNTYKLIEL